MKEHFAWAQNRPGPLVGRGGFTRRCVRGIFRRVHAAVKNDPVLSAATGGGNQEGVPPSWTFPRGTGDGSPWSAACFCWKHLQSTWPRSGFGGGRAAAAVGRESPVSCLLLLEVPAVRLAAKRLRRRGRCGGRTGVPGRLPTSIEVPAIRLAAERLRRREGRCGGRTGVPGRLPASIGSACCPPGRRAASAAGGPLRRQDGGPRSSACFYRKCLLSAWPRSGFGGKRAAAAAGRRSPGRLPASIEAPAVRLAAWRLCRREFLAP